MLRLIHNGFLLPEWNPLYADAVVNSNRISSALALWIALGDGWYVGNPGGGICAQCCGVPNGYPVYDNAGRIYACYDSKGLADLLSGKGYCPNSDIFDLDSDGDRVPDITEALTGSDPFDPDSNPWDDYSDMSKDPANDDEATNSPLWGIDSDGDGFSDAIEILLEGDPNDPYDYPSGTQCPGRHNCEQDMNPWYPYEDNEGPKQGDDNVKPDDGGGTGDGGGDGDGGGNTGGSGGTGGNGDGNGGDDGDGGGTGDGGNTGTGGNGGNGGNTGDGGNDGETPIIDVDLAGIEKRLDNILAESKNIKAKIGDNSDVVAGLNETKSAIEAGNYYLQLVEKHGEEERRLAQVAADAAKLFYDENTEISRTQLERIQELNTSVHHWYQEFHDNRKTDPFVVAAEGMLQMLTGWTAKSEQFQQNTEKFQEKVEHHFEMISEQELKALIGDEQFAKMEDGQNRLIESVGEISKQLAKDGGSDGETVAELKKIGDHLSEKGPIAGELVKILSVLEERAELWTAVDDLAEAVRQGNESTGSLVNDVIKELDEGNTEVADLLREVRDKPPVDTTSIEKVLEEIRDNQKKQQSVEVNVDLPGVEGKLASIGEQLEGIIGKLGKDDGGSGTVGDIPWAKPDRPEDMKIDLDDGDAETRLRTALDNMGLSVTGLERYTAREYSSSFKLPVGGMSTDVRYGTYDFRLNDYPSEINSSMQILKRFISTILKAVMTLIFVFKVWHLVWR